MPARESGIYLGLDVHSRAVYLDLARSSNFSVAICGSSGSGKTYTIRQLIGGYHQFGITQYVLDVHGDLDSFPGVDPGDVHTIRFDYAGGEDGARFNPLKVLPGEALNASVSEFINGTIRLYARNLGQQQVPVLREMVYDAFKVYDIDRDEPTPWVKDAPKLSDLMDVCTTYMAGDDGRVAKQANSIHAILSGMMHTDLFGEDTVVVKRGKVNRLDVSGLKDADKVAVINLTLGRVNTIAVRSARQLNPMFPSHIIVMDEAKIFNRASRSHILDSIANEGRKFGIGIVLGAQSPEHLTADQIRACSTTLLLAQHPSDHRTASRKFGIPLESVSGLSPRSDALVFMNEGGFAPVYLFRSSPI